MWKTHGFPIIYPYIYVYIYICMFIYIYNVYIYIYNVYIYIYIYISTESCLGAPSCMPLMDTLHHFHPFNPLIFQRPCSSWPICDTVPLPPQKRWLLYRICSYVLEHITVYNCGQSLIVQNNLLLFMIIFHWCPKEKGLPLCIQVWGYNNASKVLPSTVINLNFLVERSQIRIKVLQKYTNGVNIQDWRCEEYLK